MTSMQENVKAEDAPPMYIRGVPLNGADSKVETRSAVPRAPSDIHCNAGPGACATNPLARFGTASGSWAGISRSEATEPVGLMKSRRAVRLFTGAAVPMRALRDLVGAACSLGPGEEDGIVRFVMVEARPAMARVTRLAAAWLRREGVLADGAGPDTDAWQVVFGGAPHLAVAYGPSEAPGAAGACSLAVARLEWAAAAMGLGTCFAGEIIRAAAGCAEVAVALSVPEGHTAFAALFIGYPGFAPNQPATVRAGRMIWL